MTAGPAAARARGRPRSELARQAILAAATELLLTRGLDAVSMDAVAARAGVSKATIYRWWPTKETLAADALQVELSEPAPASTDTEPPDTGPSDAGPPDTGTLRGDLLALTERWISLVTGRPFGPVIAALIAEAATDPVFGALYRERYVEPRRAQVRAAFQRAIARGEIDRNTDVEAAIDLLYGPLYHRLLHGHAPLTAEFAATVVRVLVAGLGGI